MTPEEIRKQMMGSAGVGCEDAESLFAAASADAIRQLHKAAEDGDVQAQFELGRRYYFGENVGQSYKEAAKWVLAAAEQGHAEAQTRLGQLFFHGQGVEQNHKEAVRWVQAAAEQGDADGQNVLGNCFLNGQGVDQNYEEAARWCRASAEQGNSHGQDSLGDCYRQWAGSGQNLKEAVKWYQAAAEQGNPHGQNNLGECYRDGLGVERNSQEAAKWFRAAAEQGHEKGKANLQALEQSAPAQPPAPANAKPSRKKSVPLALVLAFFFGPFGLFYVSWKRALGMLLLFIIGVSLIPNNGFVVLLLWLVAPILSIIALGIGKQQNEPIPDEAFWSGKPPLQ